MARVDYERDLALEHNYPKEWPAWAKVKLHDGREVSAQVRFPKGDPENPLTWDELTDKYNDLVKPVWDATRAERVYQAVKHLAGERDMRHFTHSL